MAAVPFLLRQYRTKSVWRLCTPSACKFPFRACFVSSRTHLACIFSEIFRENTRKSTKDFLRFSLHLSKNLTTQSAYVRYETDSHISQKCSWIHQVFTPLFVSSDEKFDDASVAQSLCGIAFIRWFSHHKKSTVSCILRAQCFFFCENTVCTGVLHEYVQEWHFSQCEICEKCRRRGKLTQYLTKKRNFT